MIPVGGESEGSDVESEDKKTTVVDTAENTLFARPLARSLHTRWYITVDLPDSNDDVGKLISKD